MAVSVDDPMPGWYWKAVAISLGLISMGSLLYVVGALIDGDTANVVAFLILPFAVLGLVSIPLMSRERARFRRSSDSRQTRSSSA
jgi:predicted membrane metal-binding protein